MFKKLVSTLMILTASSCTSNKDTFSTKFSPGDCFGWKNECEKWEQYCPQNVFLVLEVGKTHYRELRTDTSQGKGGGARPDMDTIILVDTIAEKVECTQLLKDKYAEFKRK